MLRFPYISTVILVTLLPFSVYPLKGDNICYNEETYIELEQHKTTQPVQIRSYNWCFSFPPRCSNYRTEIKEVIKLQNVTKTRLVEHCCAGYVKKNIADTNEIICNPICRGGCGNGYCNSPNLCVCDIGFEGHHCTQRCRPKMFGKNCKNVCRCRNGSLCDHKNGSCRCNAGWIGDLCEIACPLGTYGLMCRKSCDCRPNQCNSITGDCFSENSQIIFDSSSGISNTSTNHSNNNIMKLFHERIKAKHWIQVNGNGKLNFKNCSTTEKCKTNNETIENVTELDITNNNLTISSNTTTSNEKIVNLIGKTHQHHVLIHKNNTLMINALNSSIANLTNDVDKLTKQVSNQQTKIHRVSNDVVILPKIGIFLDAPAPTSAVIAHISQPADNKIQPIVITSTSNNVGNVLEEVIASIPNENILKETMNSQSETAVAAATVASTINSAVIMPSLSLNQHVATESHHHRRNYLPKNQQQHEQLLSIIETSETIQQQMGQDSNDNENDDDGVTELNNNENEIFHLFDNVENDNNNNTVGDTQPRTDDNHQLISMVIIGLIFLIGLFLLGFIYICTKRQRESTEHNEQKSTNSSDEISLESMTHKKPLPDIPSFTHSITRRVVAQQSDFYDSPSNNMSVRENLNKLGYSYATNDKIEPIYAISRKCSAEHIYDEINYTGAESLAKR